MRESIGESWTIQIVAAFILLFVAFFSLMISYSKCFKTKNEVISIVEKYEGITNTSLPIIINFLNNTNYRGTGKCETSGGILALSEKNYGLTIDAKGDGSAKLEPVQSGKKYRMCVYRRYADDSETLVSYEIVLFYTFNIPVMGNIASFPVNGKTVDLDKNINVH